MSAFNLSGHRWRRYIVRHAAEKLGGKLMKDGRQVYNIVGMWGSEKTDGLLEICRQGSLRKDLQVGIAKKVYTCFALNPPKFTVCIDDSVPCDCQPVYLQNRLIMTYRREPMTWT